jgi:hypothetical protein
MSAPSPASTAAAVIAPLSVGGTGKICWTLTLGHGHAARFHNFRENCPPEMRDRSMSVGMDLYQSGDLLASLKWAETVSGRNVEIDIATWPDWLPVNVRKLMGNPTSSIASTSLAPWLPHAPVHCGLTPNSPKLQSLYSKADIFCLPTRGDFSSIASLR